MEPVFDKLGPAAREVDGPGPDFAPEVRVLFVEGNRKAPAPQGDRRTKAGETPAKAKDGTCGKASCGSKDKKKGAKCDKCGKDKKKDGCCGKDKKPEDAAPAKK